MHTLYKLTFSSGKCYIGQTTRTLKIRISQHRQSAMRGESQLPVHCAWRKYGEPDIEVIGEHGSDEELHQAEILAITEHCSLAPSGYNVSFGGDTAPSKSPSVAAKIAEKAKGRKHSDETKVVLSDSLKGRWKNDDYREKVSAGLKATWTEDRREATSDRAKALWDRRRSEGWEMPDAQKEKLSKRTFSDETKRKMSESAKARKREPVSDETRRKMSENAKRQWADKEHSERRVVAVKEAWDDEARNRMSSKASESWKDPEIRARRTAAIRAAKQTKSD